MTVTLIGNKNGVYIDPKNNNAVLDYSQAKNFQEVKLYGVNHLVIRRDDNGAIKIVQAGGYNRIRGLFTDLY